MTPASEPAGQWQAKVCCTVTLLLGGKLENPMSLACCATRNCFSCLFFFTLGTRSLKSKKKEWPTLTQAIQYPRVQV